MHTSWCCLLVFRLTGELCSWADNPIYQSVHLLQIGVVCQLLLVLAVLFRWRTSPSHDWLVCALPSVKSHMSPQQSDRRRAPTLKASTPYGQTQIRAWSARLGSGESFLQVALKLLGINSFVNYATLKWKNCNDNKVITQSRFVKVLK